MPYTDFVSSYEEASLLSSFQSGGSTTFFDKPSTTKHVERGDKIPHIVSSIDNNHCDTAFSSTTTSSCINLGGEVEKLINTIKGYALICVLPDSTFFRGIILTRSQSQPQQPYDAQKSADSLRNKAASAAAIQEKNFYSIIKKLLNPLCNVAFQDLVERDFRNHSTKPASISTNKPNSFEHDISTTNGIGTLFNLKGSALTPTTSCFKQNGTEDSTNEEKDSKIFYLEEDDNESIVSNQSCSHRRRDQDEQPASSQTIILNNHSTTDNQQQSKGEDISNYNVELIEEDTPHHINYGQVRFKGPRAFSCIYPCSTNGPSSHDPNSGGFEDDQLMAKTISAPELSSMYRQKKLSNHQNHINHNYLDPNSFLFENLSISGDNLKFSPRMLYNAEQADILISKSFTKDLISRGCIVCVGDVEMKHPVTLSRNVFYHTHHYNYYQNNHENTLDRSTRTFNSGTLYHSRKNVKDQLNPADVIVP